MSGSVQRRSRRGEESIFYRDLRTTKVWSSSSSASAWPHGFGAQEPPPPPILTLQESLQSTPNHHRFTTPTQTVGTSDWQSPVFERDPPRPQDDAWAQQSRGLLLLAPPSPRQPAAPVVQGSAPADGHAWVTVYGFSPHYTNLVLREFEKCGTILKHAPGPSGANWVHVLYEVLLRIPPFPLLYLSAEEEIVCRVRGFLNYNDAQKALQKNGMQISAALIIGVKPVDLLQHQSLTEKVNTGFLTLPLGSSGEVTKSASSVKASSRPYYLQQPNEGCQRLSGAMASPSKSLISRLVDLLLGI